MLIEVESLKELEPGKTYAVQIVEPDNPADLEALCSSILEIGVSHNIAFVIFGNSAKLIDAPVAC